MLIFVFLVSYCTMVMALTRWGYVSSKGETQPGERLEVQRK